jgi:hypothetical protein
MNSKEFLFLSGLMGILGMPTGASFATPPETKKEAPAKKEAAPAPSKSKDFKPVTPILSLHLNGREIAGQKISPEGAEVTFNNGKTAHLDLIGADIRIKKATFLNIPIKIYVGQVFGENISAFNCAEDALLPSLKDVKTFAIQLTFLRDITQSQFADGFFASLEKNKEKNGSDRERADIKQMISLLDKLGNLPENTQVTVVGEYRGNEEWIHTGASKIDPVTGKMVKPESIKGAPGFIRAIFSSWLGLPADDGATNFRIGVCKEFNEKHAPKAPTT